jgi:hypothetical protein
MSEMLANTALRHGYHEDARQYALKSIRHDPTTLRSYI